MPVLANGNTHTVRLFTDTTKQASCPLYALHLSRTISLGLPRTRCVLQTVIPGPCTAQLIAVITHPRVLAASCPRRVKPSKPAFDFQKGEVSQLVGSTRALPQMTRCPKVRFACHHSRAGAKDSHKGLACHDGAMFGARARCASSLLPR